MNEAGNGAASASDRPVFEVWRQDDNGNRYLMSRHLDRSAAESAVAEIESGVQHKQLYWIAERGSAPHPQA